MRETDQPADEASVAIDPGIECPLCKDAEHGSLEEHLLEGHSAGELAELVAKFVLGREETGTIR
jgi:hypothetical protein